MYGGAYPPYPGPPHGQQPPVGYGPPPGQFPPPPGSSPYIQPSLNHPTAPHQPSPMGFGPPPAVPGNPSQQSPPPPMGYGPPPTLTPASQQHPPPSQASQPQQTPIPQNGLLPASGPMPVPPNAFHHLVPPPGFPHLHPMHLPRPGLQQPPLHPPHSHPQFQHHPPPNFMPQSRHVGLGAHGQPHNINSIISPPLNLNASGTINSQPALAALPSRPAPTEIYSLFVGSIADGVDDAWLERLLGCAGHLVSLRRIRDPNGKPKPFGFAEYGDPESVLRCLKVIDGAKLPINGGRAGEKSLMVKPDDKTKARLDAYEATRIKTDQDNELDTQAVERLEGLISQMKDPDILAATASEPASSDAPSTTPNAHAKKSMAAHLQDLAPEDLPEESRGLITREIQFFRERAISKRGDAEKSKEQRDRAGRDGGSGSPAGPRGFGTANNHKAGYGSSNSTPMGPRGSATGTSGSPVSNDPQSFNRPMGFVRAGQMAAAQQQLGTGGQGNGHDTPSPLTDEDEERLREDRRKRMNHLEFKDRERRWETRERHRAQSNQRDQQREKSIKEEEIRLRNQMKARLSNWDDDIEMDRGKELFYSNRSKWRTNRRTFRQREEKSDRIDEELENEQLEAIRKESEAFLNKQAEMIAKIQDENRKAGLLQLDEGGKPIQLSFGGFSAHHNAQQSNGKVVAGGSTNLQPISLKKDNKSAGGVLGGAEDDDDGFRRKRALIPLTYDEEDGPDKSNGTKINIQFGKTEVKPKETAAMVEENKKKKMLDIVASIPNDKDELWKVKLDWKWLNETIIDEKIKPFANKKIIEYLGMQEDELLSAIIDHIRAHQGAQGLVTELEPVLAEEAEEFTYKIWRVVVFELRAAQAGLISAAST